jgi:hypothetical protein
LELQAVVLASRPAKTILEESRFHFTRIIYFTDSLVVLAWIQGQSRCYKPFVSCRIGEIQSTTEPTEWLHCPTHLNIADDLTKGIAANELHSWWLEGPQFLKQPDNQWPLEHGAADRNEVDRERRKPTLAQAVTVKQPVIKPEEYSTWDRLLRVTAYTMRFIHNFCIKYVKDRANEGKTEGPLSAQEINKAEVHWIKNAQRSLHKRRDKGDCSTLTPFIDVYLEEDLP